MSLEVKVEPIGDEHIEPYVQLSRAEYGESAAVSQADHLRWKFIDNPEGRSMGIHIHREGELVGRMVALPRLFLWKEKIYKAAVIVDFLVHPKARGMESLLELVMALERLSGFDLLLMIAPNPAGAAVWEHLVKVPAPFELDVAVAPLRPASLLQSAGKLPSGPFAPVVDRPSKFLVRGAFRLRGAPGRAKIETAWPTASEIDRMRAPGWGDCVAAGLRSAEYLDWRYRRSPVFQYNVFFLRQEGELCGYLVTRRAVYDNIDCLFVVDAFGSPQLTPASWRTAIATAIAQTGTDCPEMAMILGNTQFGPLASVNSFPFLTVPSRFLPRKMTIFAKWVATPGFEICRDNLYVALGDSDVI
jgi:hypothetical protein